ncbi:MAG TPA: MFS transporter [Candidatus Limnocylindrales bacterium]
MASAVPTGQAAPSGGLAGMTPSGRAIVPVAWSLYDFANTIFSYAIVSTAIGLWLTSDERFGQGLGQLVQGLTIAISVGLNALVSPILGALSDRGGARLPFLLFFTALTIVPSAIIGPTPAVVGAILFTIANFGYQAALIYYDATLSSVSKPESRGKLSGIGVGVGYMGTIFTAVTLILLGITESPDPIFFIAGVLFAIFAIPMFLIVRDPPRAHGTTVTWADARSSLGQIRVTIDHARGVPGLLRFLVGRFFYSDAVNTLIVVMSVVAVKAVGLTQGEWLVVSVVLTVVAIVASFGWGWLTDRHGPKRALITVLATWVVGLLLGAASLGMAGTATGIAIFVVAGAILGSGLGGVQVADRVFMIRLSPPARLGEFFGLYGLVGKGSQVVGQLLYGVIIFLFFDSLGNGAYQLAILSLLVTMGIGLWLVWPVSDQWAGSDVGEPPVAASPVMPPERLAPASAPIEPRDR